MTLRPSLPAITPGFAFAALIGAVAAAALPSLPNMAALAIIGILGVLLCLFVPLRWAGAFLLGASWLLWAADVRLQARLPASMAAQDFLINGRVEGLPAQEPELVRFDFRVIDAPPEASLLRGELLRVAWYRSNEGIDAGS
jgi:predicted membrane metal-binding protein